MSVTIELSNADGRRAINIAMSETNMMDKAFVLETPTKPARKTNEPSWTPNPPSEIGNLADARASGTVATRIWSGTDRPRPMVAMYAISAQRRLSATDSRKKPDRRLG